MSFIRQYILKRKQRNKNRKISFIKYKYFYITKEIIYRKQHMEWKKIFTSHIANTGLMPKIHKELILVNNKPNNLFIKLDKNINRPFPGEKNNK